MKQHITKKQWDELSEEQQYELESQDFDGKHYWHITIGQMIEFLGYKWQFIICYHSSFGDIALRPDNICDALWESVKYKLKKI